MKIVLFVLGALVAVVLLAVLTLAVMGRRPNARHLEADIEINQPPEVVWAWITETEYLKQWVSWLVEIEDLTPAVDGAGAKFRWYMDDPNMNERVEMTSEVLEHRPPEYIELSLSMEGAFTGAFSYTLVDLGEGRTRLETTGDYEYFTWFARIMEPLITRAAQKKQDEDFARLKSLAESDASASLEVLFTNSVGAHLLEERAP